MARRRPKDAVEPENSMAPSTSARAAWRAGARAQKSQRRGECEGEEEDGDAGLDHHGYGEVEGRAVDAERVQCGAREEKAERAADGCDGQRFDDELESDAGSGGAERGADGELARAVGGASGVESAEVDAGSEEHQRGENMRAPRSCAMEHRARCR